MARILILLAAVLVSACAGKSEQISDYSTRSTVYGWIDIDEASGNELINVTLRRFQPPSEFPYYHMSFDEMAGGYVFYNFGYPHGAFKLDNIKSQSCLGVLLCDNTINQYDFGSQGGGVGAIEIAEPGVYHLGNLSLHNEETNFFSPSTFSLRESDGGPSKRQMLEFILGNAEWLKEHPDVAARIRAEISAL